MKLPTAAARLASWCTLVAAVLISTTTPAAPSDADRARANELMDRGDQLVEQGQLAEALTQYREAHALMGVPSTGIEVARTLERLGRLVEAWKAARAVTALPAEAGEPEPFAQARAAAVALTRTLEARIPKLTIAVKGLRAGAAASTRIDGRPIAAAEAAHPHRLDPGTHEIEAHHDGEVRKARIELAEGAQQTVTLTFPRAAGPAERPSPPQVERSNRTLGYVVGGIGLAGLATAAVTGVMIMSRDEEIQRNCPNQRCNAEGQDLVEGSRTLLAVNLVAFGVGAVGTGLGATLVLTSGADGEVALAPRAGSGAGGVSVFGRF